jgi:hypothetical protein
VKELQCAVFYFSHWAGGISGSALAIALSYLKTKLSWAAERLTAHQFVSLVQTGEQSATEQRTALRQRDHLAPAA